MGLDPENGLDLGTLYQHRTKVSLNLTRLLQKHAALLGQSGGGKSYLASVMIEELLSRRKEQGRLAVVVIDVHGEYTAFAEKVVQANLQDFSDKVTVLKGSYFEIAARHLTPILITDLAPQMSVIQARELNRIIEDMRKKMTESKQTFALSDVINAVE